MATLFSKLQYKNSQRILLLNAPDEFQPLLSGLEESVEIDTQIEIGESYEFALVFVASGAKIAEHAASATATLSDDGVLWFAYPKKSSKKYKTDISRDNGWQPLGVSDSSRCAKSPSMLIGRRCAFGGRAILRK